MLASAQFSPWLWAGFLVLLLVSLALDLRVFHRRPREMRPREALLGCAVWFSLALLFAGVLRPLRGEKSSLEFLTAYLLELSLSLDNLFVIGLVFAWFGVPAPYRHRVLFWGVLGAMLMRGILIGAGLALVSWAHWLFYGFGAFLVFSSARILFSKTQLKPEKNIALKLARKFFPVAPALDGDRFVTRLNGRAALTPLALVLVLIETGDLLFATDSIPAVFAVSTDPFVVFTSNILAVLGLRSLYFVLEGALACFRYLKYGLSLVLMFAGVKLLLDPHGRSPRWFQVEIPVSLTLPIVGAILLLTVGLSVAVSRRENTRRKRD
jgi:tellurite resistance protein TerC